MSGTAPWRYGPAALAPQLRVPADDGCALNVHVLREASQGAEPSAAVLFVHALAMDGLMWQGVVDALGAGGGGPGEPGLPGVTGAMYAVDCRGHGASGTTPAPFTTARFAQDLVDVMDALALPRVHLVGCSMGGTVALALAGRRPERLASLTVIDTTAWYGPEAPAHWERRAATAEADGMAALVDFQRARWFSPAFLAAQPALAAQSVAVFTANRVPAYASSCRMLGKADERAALAAYSGPAAVVVGEDDYATPPAMAEDIAARLTDATLTVIAGTRHYTPLEAPAQVANCIEAVAGRSAAPALAATH